jgi:hypothetical protein
MFFSRFIFKIIVSIPFILIFNGLLIGLLFSLVHQGLTVECVTMIKRLRLEALSLNPCSEPLDYAIRP